jgi:hypothetical protein
MIVFALRIRHALMLAALAFFAAKPTSAVNISDTGLGEALIFPYYLANGNSATLLSIANRTDKPKALKVHVREGMNGAAVFSFNLFLAAQDVWTGALVATGTTDAAGIVTADVSCTTPKISGATLSTFSARNFQSDSPPLRTVERTREGYIEVFEMATIEPTSPTGKDVSFTNGVFPARNVSCNLVSDQAIAANRADFLAPSGGLTGNATIVSGSMSTGYDAIALQSLGIRTGATSAESASPDWTDVTNTTAMLIDGSDATNPRMIAARFDRGLDAVSALFMSSALTGDYSYDRVLATDWVVTMPTKRLYVNNGAPLGPFQNAWNGASGDGTAKVDTDPTSFTREGQSSLAVDCFGVQPPFIPPTANWSTGVFKFRQGDQDSANASALSARNTQTWFEYTRCGNGYAIQAQSTEGGWGNLRLLPVSGESTTRRLVSRADSTVISSNGTQSAGSLTFVGLPAIGIAIAAARFPAAAYENFNSSYWLKTTRLIR